MRHDETSTSGGSHLRQLLTDQERHQQAVVSVTNAVRSAAQRALPNGQDVVKKLATYFESLSDLVYAHGDDNLRLVVYFPSLESTHFLEFSSIAAQLNSPILHASEQLEKSATTNSEMPNPADEKLEKRAIVIARSLFLRAGKALDLQQDFTASDLIKIMQSLSTQDPSRAEFALDVLISDSGQGARKSVPLSNVVDSLRDALSVFSSRNTL